MPGTLLSLFPLHQHHHNSLCPHSFLTLSWSFSTPPSSSSSPHTWGCLNWCTPWSESLICWDLSLTGMWLAVMIRWSRAFWKHTGGEYPPACGHLPTLVKTEMPLFYEQRGMMTYGESFLWFINPLGRQSARAGWLHQTALEENISGKLYPAFIFHSIQNRFFLNQDWKTTAHSIKRFSHMKLWGTHGLSGFRVWCPCPCDSSQFHDNSSAAERLLSQCLASPEGQTGTRKFWMTELGTDGGRLKQGSNLLGPESIR